jgi:superkiller protein 3
MRTKFVTFVAALAVAATAAAQVALPGARDRARAPYEAGLENMQTEAWDAAVAFFKSAIDIDPTFEMAHYMLGRTFMAQKRFVEAVSAYEKCRALYQQQSGRQFANAQERQRSRDTRLREIDELIRSYQSLRQTTQVQDTIRQLQNQKRIVEEAMSRGNSTMTLSLTVPSYVSTALGSAYFRSGNLQAAEREYKAAIEADGKVGEAHSNLAVVYMETGRLGEAEKAVQAAERVGFRVAPALKAEIAKRKAGTY